MEDFLKLLGGTWLHSRDENMKNLLESMKAPQEDIDFVLTSKPTVKIERQGDKILNTSELTPEFITTVTYELGKEFEAKDENSETPRFHNKVLLTFDGTKAKISSRSLLEGARKLDTVATLYIKNDELVYETSPMKADGEPDTSIVGSRFYTKKQ